jgi:hypothetical protein
MGKMQKTVAEGGTSLTLLTTSPLVRDVNEVNQVNEVRQPASCGLPQRFDLHFGRGSV